MTSGEKLFVDNLTINQLLNLIFLRLNEGFASWFAQVGSNITNPELNEVLLAKIFILQI